MVHEDTKMAVISKQEEAKAAEQSKKTEMKDIKGEVGKGRTELADILARATKEAEVRAKKLAKDMEEAQKDLKETLGKDRDGEIQEH